MCYNYIDDSRDESVRKAIHCNEIADNARTFVPPSTWLSLGTLQNLWLGHEADNWRVDG